MTDSTTDTATAGTADSAAASTESGASVASTAPAESAESSSTGPTAETPVVAAEGAVVAAAVDEKKAVENDEHDLFHGLLARFEGDIEKLKAFIESKV